MGYLSAGLLFVIATVYAEGEDDILTSCLELFNPENNDKSCCESIESFNKIDKDTKDCHKEDSEEWQCEDFQCILRKYGLLKSDKIDEDGANKFLDEIEREYPKDKSVVDKVRNECLDGKYEAYPPEDVCPVMRFFICTYINIYLECSSWKKTETCSKMAEQAQKCKLALEK
ncbi:uncharacterized protein LOC126781042 isoform X2 [Nymphalis io]|uniref:uncharacterized protein LOC126781042 isoform X1 n=1 Tax=Inachis io TaxID=171585 RepID=UPI0021674927|nr:uncharacterized protein LOC126781042 isoform X1 [Nymphalis io]XP_050361766.1 uncharacterized protein LOC126781042 isoform X2 [Nymphalis io]